MDLTLTPFVEDIRLNTPEDDLLLRVREAAKMSFSLTLLSEGVLAFFVRKSREGGHSWQEIGDTLGVSKQAALKRFGTERVHPEGWETWTDLAQAVVTKHAFKVAASFSHNYAGSEHLLAGLLTEPTGIAAELLHEVQITLDVVLDGIEERLGRGRGQGKGGFTPLAWHILDEASAAATALNHPVTGTAHILMALQVSGSLAEELASSRGLTAAHIAAAIGPRYSTLGVESAP